MLLYTPQVIPNYFQLQYFDADSSPQIIVRHNPFGAQFKAESRVIDGLIEFYFEGGFYLWLIHQLICFLLKRPMRFSSCFKVKITTYFDKANVEESLIFSFLIANPSSYSSNSLRNYGNKKRRINKDKGISLHLKSGIFSSIMDKGGTQGLVLATLVNDLGFRPSGVH